MIHSFRSHITSQPPIRNKLGDLCTANVSTDMYPCMWYKYTTDCKQRDTHTHGVIVSAPYCLRSIYEIEQETELTFIYTLYVNVNSVIYT